MKIKLFLVFIALSACNYQPGNQGENRDSKSSSPAFTLEGNYVSDDYAQRNEGYDWVAVAVTRTGDSLFHVSVRSRADRKKPTCTFDAESWTVDEKTLKTIVDGKAILFRFDADSLRISAELEEDEGILYYYCSGGGNLGGPYRKIEEPLDESQIDPRVYVEFLNYSDYNFYVSTTGKGSLQTLTVEPYGLQIDNTPVIMEIEGKVTGAEVGDLNIDGFPELMIYTQSAGSGSYGQVIGFSVNNGKSMSQVAFPDIMDNAGASKGYMGHDEFAIVESTLVRRFPVYNPGDSNSEPTGGTRQIQYKLKEGEASRVLMVDKVIEY